MSLFNRQSLSTLPSLPLFSQLSDEMNRFWNTDSLLARRQGDLLGDWQPNIDIEQKNNMYLIKADIPGVNPKDIKVTMDNGNLVIEGRRESKVEENRDNYRCVERSYGSFYRSMNLPDASDAKGIEAHSHNGVLEVTVPISETAKHKKIEIKVD